MQTFRVISITQKMKYLFLILFLWCLAYAQATTKDTLLHVRFVSGADSAPLCFAQVNAIEFGTHIASWKTDGDGYIRVSRKEIQLHPRALMTIDYPGFEKEAFKADTLPARDTTIISLKPKRSELDEIIVTAYRQPLLYKKLGYWQRKRFAKKPDPQPVHSVKQCLAHEALQKGLWLKKDTMTQNVILAWDSLRSNYKYWGEGVYEMLHRYLSVNINYPRQAQHFFMEETVYLCFEFDEKGSLQYLQVIQGKHTDLVLEVANALARMPRLGILRHQNAYQPAPKPERFFLSVKFVLK